VLAPNGKTLYVSNEDGPVAVFNVNDDTLAEATPATLSHGPATSLSVTVSPDGKTLYTGDSSTTTGNYDALSLVPGSGYGKVLASASAPSGTVLDAAAISANGTTLYGVWQSANDETASYLTQATIPPAASKLVVTGKPVAGKTIRAKLKAVKSAAVTYSWYAAGKPLKGKTHAGLKITAALKGKRLQARATVSAAGYSRTTLKSAQSSPIRVAARKRA
jgi:hypothetical protein